MARQLTPAEQEIINGLKQGWELCEWRPHRGGDILLHFGHGKAPRHVNPTAFRSLLAKGLIEQVDSTNQRWFYDLVEDDEC